MNDYLYRLLRRLSGRPAEQVGSPSRRGRELRVEPLESRAMLAANPLLLPSITFTVSVGDTTGDLEIETLPHLALTTVENFSNYIEDEDFLNGIFHRLDKTPGQQVIQAGLLTSPTQAFTDANQFGFVPTDPPIVNEPDATLRPNVRGAVGTARTSNPNSATSQFFINTQDNPGFDEPLAPVGFTVFGNLTTDSLATLDLIALLDVLPEAPLGLNTVPFADANAGTRNLVRIEAVSATGTLHGTVFDDMDGNGTREAGEDGIENVIVYVDINTNGILDVGDIDTMTNSEGRYAFELDLADAEEQSFVVRQIPPISTIATAPAAGFHSVIVRPGLDTDFVDFADQTTSLPIVEIEATIPNAAEAGEVPGQFRIFISNAASATFNGNFQAMFSVGGTAADSADYTLDDPFVILGPGITSVTVDIPPVDDEIEEGNETVILTLLPTANTYEVGASNTATVTIADDEAGSSLAGNLYLDRDGNGTQDDGDLTIGGVSVNVTGSNDFDETVETASDGTYRIEGLPAGGTTINEDPEQLLQVFLQNGNVAVGSQGGTADRDADQINVSNLPTATEGTGNDFNELGRRSEFISKRDLLASTPEEDILAAVDAEANETDWFALSAAWQGFENVSLSLSSDMTEVTLTVTDSDQNMQFAVLDATDSRRVRFLGNVGDTFLIGVVGDPDDFMFEGGGAMPAGLPDVDPEDVGADDERGDDRISKIENDATEEDDESVVDAILAELEKLAAEVDEV